MFSRSEDNHKDGEINFGDVDTTKFDGTISYTATNDKGSAGVDGSGSSRKVAALAIHISIIQGDVPVFVIDLVAEKKLIKSNLVGFSLSRSEDNHKDGEINFGEVDFPILVIVF
jgi:hypothetical protein